MDKILAMLKNFCDDFVLFGRILPVIMAMLPVFMVFLKDISQIKRWLFLYMEGFLL